MGGTISLLHATYFRPGGPIEVRDAWLDAAQNRESVDYVVAMDANDIAAVVATQGCVRAVSPISDAVTAVRNWNAAAAVATGHLLVVVADDLFPPPGWDEELWRVVDHLDPQRTAFAIKVQDSPDPTDHLLRHPVVSRAYYETLGLFHDSFSGVYCDNDATMTAYWKAFVFDGRSIRLEHRHPELVEGLAATPSHKRMNERSEYERGRATFAARWPHWQRQANIQLVEPGYSARRAVLRRRFRVARLLALRLRRGIVRYVRGLLPT